jgi:hypothetical protein
MQSGAARPPILGLRAEKRAMSMERQLEEGTDAVSIDADVD